jgi:hypothetical protein
MTEAHGTRRIAAVLRVSARSPAAAGVCVCCRTTGGCNTTLLSVHTHTHTQRETPARPLTEPMGAALMMLAPPEAAAALRPAGRRAHTRDVHSGGGGAKPTEAPTGSASRVWGRSAATLRRLSQTTEAPGPPQTQVDLRTPDSPNCWPATHPMALPWFRHVGVLLSPPGRRSAPWYPQGGPQPLTLLQITAPASCTTLQRPL